MEQPKPAAEHPPGPAPARAPHLDRPTASIPAAGPATRVREGVGDGLFFVRRFVRESWSDFRRRDRHFQWKAGVITAWVLTSLLAIRISMGSPEALASNGLQAYVAVNQTTMSWGLLVHNRSDEPWTGVRVVLDGGWTHERATIGAGERIVLSPENFVLGDEPAPADLAIAGVRVETERGSATPTLVR